MNGKWKSLKQAEEERGLPYKILYTAAVQGRLKTIRPGDGAHARYFTCDAYLDLFEKEAATWRN